MWPNYNNVNRLSVLKKYLAIFHYESLGTGTNTHH